MPTPDSATQALTPLVLIVTAAFGAGILSGLYRRLLPIGLAENTERVKTLTMAISLSCALVGGLIAAAAAGWFLFVRCPTDATCPPLTATLWPGQLWPGADAAGFPRLAATLYIDRLAALFIFLIAALSIGVSLYSFGWLAGDDQRNRVAGFYNLFVLSLLYVIIANHVFFLSLVLEVATLAFGYLILYKHNRYPDVQEHHRAVVAYLIISQLSTVLILAAFLILAYAQQQSGFCGDVLSLSTLRHHPNAIPEPVATVVFLLAFGGLSIRAGAFPLHFWVPLAHPASPTTTHAMSLGIGIKVALYVMLRMFFEFLPPTAAWWGWVVILVGGLTAAYNVFFAALSHDLKRALAYHSVENIGIMLVGIGLAMAARASDTGTAVSTVLVRVGLVAALYHLINHAVFKSLLYLCTGIIEKRTGGTVLIQQLGGVWRYYPWTAAAFLIGAVAIAGLPPFNGFISEWLTLAGLFTSLEPTTIPLGSTGPGLVATTLGVLLLGLAFSLTAVAFVKIAGRAILGVPDEKTWRDAQKGDAPLNMLGVVGVLAGLCLVLGLYPQPVLQLLSNIATDLGASKTKLIQFTGNSVGWGNITLSLEPGWLLAGLLMVTLGWVWVRARRVRRSRVWAGGVTYEPRRMQYTDAAFLYLLWERFSDKAHVEPPTSHRFAAPDYLYARFRISARSSITGVFRRLFNTVLYLGHTLAESVGNHVQNGDIRWYLLYILIAFLVALIVLVLQGAP